MSILTAEEICALRTLRLMAAPNKFIYRGNALKEGDKDGVTYDTHLRSLHKKGYFERKKDKFYFKDRK